MRKKNHRRKHIQMNLSLVAKLAEVLIRIVLWWLND
jgi:hypothetical protein